MMGRMSQLDKLTMETLDQYNRCNQAANACLARQRAEERYASLPSHKAWAVKANGKSAREILGAISFGQVDESAAETAALDKCNGAFSSGCQMYSVNGRMY